MFIFHFHFIYIKTIRTHIILFVTYRWNATLAMIESILDNIEDVNGALRRTSNCMLCGTLIERMMLEDLKHFLKPFSEFTKLVSSNLPSLGLVVLI
jgi:hypothetical protein